MSMPDSIPTNRQAMYNSNNIPPYAPPAAVRPFKPNEAQLARAKRLTRFNRLFVYLPLGIFALIGLGLVLFMLYLAIWPPYADTRPFLSGLADMILILFMLPVLLVCGLVQGGLIGGIVYWRRSGSEDGGQPDPAAQYGRIRVGLWRLDQLLDKLFNKIEAILPRVAQPVIAFNAVLAYIGKWLENVKKMLTRR